jgi:hypothetical protein
MPASEARRQLRWIREFSECLPNRPEPTEVTVRDVVLYFAEHCDEFDDSVEWYYRYKAIESFFEEMTRTFGLPTNQIRGLYDESDLEPDLLERFPPRGRVAPVNWSREEYYVY